MRILQAVVNHLFNGLAVISMCYLQALVEAENIIAFPVHNRKAADTHRSSRLTRLTYDTELIQECFLAIPYLLFLEG